MTMLSEYSCLCGFRTLFIHKFITHAKSCHVFKQREMEAYPSLSALKSVGLDAG
jgi:hypothetical protein